MSVLRKKTAHIPLLGGRNDRLDPKTLGIAPWLTVAQNVYRTRTGEWAPRHSFILMSQSPLGSPPALMDTVRKLGGRGNELVAMTSREFWSFIANGTVWRNLAYSFNQRQDQRVVTHEVRDIPWALKPSLATGFIRSTATVDCAVGDGYIVHVWLETQNTPAMWWSVTDTATGQAVMAPQVVAGAGGTFARPKVVFSEGAFLLFWAEEGGASSSLRVAKLPSSTLTLAAAVNVATDMLGTATGTPWYDVQVRSSGNVVFAYRGTGPNVRAGEWDPTTNAISIAITTVVASDVAQHAIGFLSQPVLGVVTLATAVNSATGVVVRFLNQTTLAQTSSQTVKTNPGDVASITGWDDGSQQVLLWEVRHATDSKLHKVDYGVVTGGVVTGTFLYAGCLASVAFRVSSTTWYVMVTAPWEKQPGYYVCSADGVLGVGNTATRGFVARFLRGNGASVPLERNALCRVPQVSAGTQRYAFPLQRVYDVRSPDVANLTGISTRPVVALAEFAGVPPPALSHGASIIFPGSMPRIYSGDAVDEIGFNIDPEPPFNLTLQAGNELEVGTYQYCVVFSYLEGNQLYQSAPSTSASINTTGGNERVQLTIRAPWMGNRGQPQGQLYADLYRTKVNGTVFYRAKGLLMFSNVSTLPSPANDVLTYTDILSDAALETQTPLYSNVSDAGTPLVYQPPPSSRSMWIADKRLLAIDSETPTDVWASNEIQPGRGWAFHPDMRVRIEQDGAAFAGCCLDGRSIVFKRNAIYTITGDWPNANGQGSLPLVQKVAEGFGCIQPETVCVTSDGVWFKDPKKGRCFLDRALSVSQPGKQVQGLDTINDVAATLVEDFEQVRWLNGATPGTATDSPVYDYLEKQWSTWTILAPTALTCAAVVGGVYYVGTSAGRVLFYDPTSTAYQDAGSNWFVNMSTALPLANVEGLQRVYRATLLGLLGSAGHRLVFRIQNDHASVAGANSERKEIVAPSATEEPTGALAVTLRPRFQRTTRINLNWFYLPGTIGGAALRFSAIALELGLAGKLRRLPKGNQR